MIPWGKEKRINRMIPLFGLLPHQGQQESEEKVARTPRESQPAGGERRGEGGTILWHQSLLNASGNYQWAMGCPTLQKGQALGEFIAMLEASFLISPYFSMCDSPKEPSTPPGNTWAFPVQGRKYINFRFHIWGILAKSWVPRQFQSCAVSSLPRHPTSQ